MNLLQMSFSGGVMIMAVIVIRAFAINRLPKKTFIALWGIVLLRLLVPFFFPSPFSAYSLVNNHVTAPQGTVLIKTTPIFPAQPVVSPSTGGIIQEQTVISISPYVIVWAIGMIACVFFFTVFYFKCRREFRESLPIKNDFLTRWIAGQKLTRTIEIRQCGRILSPLTYGVFKPVILMPKNTKWDDTKQLEYILAHEIVHVRRFDAAAKLFLTAALCVHWFNPLVWAMYILSNRDIELSCDETVVRSFGEPTKSAYALTLIGMEEKKNTLTPLCNNFSKSALEERITAIMKIKKTSILTVLIACGLIISVTTAFATSAATAAAMENSENNSPNSPIRISDKEIAPGGKISLGSQFFSSDTECKVLLTWTGNGSLTILYTSLSDVTKSFSVESGEETTFQIDTADNYTISIRNDNTQTIGNVNGTIDFKQNTQSPQSQSINTPSSLNTSISQTVTYKNVEMRRYEGADGHPYIHDTKENGTIKEIAGCEYGMLAFDKDGNPLKIDWWSIDTEAESTYFYLDETSNEIAPSETYDVRGGWSLNLLGTDSSVEQIAYVLYCDKKITFKDGTVWTNPDFDNWRSTYEGKKVDVNILKNYYPYEQEITFAKQQA